MSVLLSSYLLLLFLVGLRGGVVVGIDVIIFFFAECNIIIPQCMITNAIVEDVEFFLL